MRNKLLKKAAVILLAFLMVFFSAISAFAANGDVNVDAGGGTMEEVDSEGKSVWHVGDEGVRIYVNMISKGAII